MVSNRIFVFYKHLFFLSATKCHPSLWHLWVLSENVTRVVTRVAYNFSKIQLVRSEIWEIMTAPRKGERYSHFYLSVLRYLACTTDRYHKRSVVHNEKRAPIKSQAYFWVWQMAGKYKTPGWSFWLDGNMNKSFGAVVGSLLQQVNNTATTQCL